MTVVAAPRAVLARSGSVMAVAQLAVGGVCLLAARDVTPESARAAFRLFATFALVAALALVLLTLANLVGAPALLTGLAAAAGVALAAALVLWVLAVARDVGTTWLWLGAPLWLVNGWLALGTWRSRDL